MSKFDQLTEDEMLEITENIQLDSPSKGSILLREGELSNKCYFILKGCIRQYCILDGEEKTTAFYTEHQAVVLFSSFGQQVPSKHFFVCVEDCLLIVGEMGQEQDMYDKFPKLQGITRNMMEQNFGKIQEDFALFQVSSPEERYLNLIQTRPDLLQRIPQHQIASYLGMTPESLSRIRKRLLKKK